MNNAEIALQLRQAYADFHRFIAELDDTAYLYAGPGKWSAGQQLDHLVRSVRPLAQVLLLPKFVFPWFFGRSNRPSRSYDALVARYQEKVVGAVAPPSFTPPPPRLDRRAKRLAALEREVRRLTKRTRRFSESELDSLILPHPLLGKVTLREMLYFTIYHAGHHQAHISHQLTQRN